MRFSYELPLDEPVPIAAGTYLPERFTARFEFPGTDSQRPGDHTYDLAIAVENGAPVCNEIRVIRNPLRASLSEHDLRRVPVANWVAFACSHAGLQARSGGEQVILEPASEDETRDVFDELSRTPRRRTITDALLREVAAIHASALGSRSAAIEAIRGRYNVSRPTAFRYIKQARERGFITDEEEEDVTR